jgi:hypothetical protein
MKPKEDPVLNNIRAYALSDDDIRKILGKDISIVIYDQLKHTKNIDDIFDKKGRCILLYQNQSPTSGHWVCLLKKKDHIEYFDSYGEKMDDMLKEIPKDLKIRTNAENPYLTRLLKSSGLPVVYNKYQYQRDGGDVNSCGRWCIARLLYGSKDNNYFRKVVDIANKRGMTNDDFVSALTSNWLGYGK